MDAEQGLDLRKSTAKRKAPPQGSTVMDAQAGFELNKTTANRKLVFSGGAQKVSHQVRCTDFRNQVGKNPDVLQGEPENPESERDKRDGEEVAKSIVAGGQLLPCGIWPPVPPPSAQHGLWPVVGPVVGQSLGLGHGQDSPTVSGQVVPPPSAADASPAPDAPPPLPLAPPPSVADASPAAPPPPAPPAAHVPPHPPTPSKPEPPPPPPPPPPPCPEKAGGCVLHTAGKRRLTLTPNPNYKRSAPRQTLFFRRELEPFDIFRVDK